MNISIVGFSADGDTAYSPMINHIHLKIQGDVVKCFHTDCEDETLFASDILHILRRARYRVVSKEICCGFAEKKKINLTDYKGFLKLSNSVFSDDETTKMKDE